MNLTELKRKNFRDLSDLAAEYRVEGAGGMQRQELIFALLKAEGERRGDITAEGVLETLPDGFGFLRSADSNYLPGPDDVYVSPSQIRRFNLRTGDTVSGRIRAPKESERYFALLKVESVGGASPDARRDRIVFDDLTPVHPDQRLALEHDPSSLSTRIVDLLVPLGRGQRCLIASPPRAGKTVLLRDIAGAIETNHPDVHVIVLLVDERPEEVTEMERRVRGDVISSTFDEPAAHHVQVAEIVIEKAKRLAEAGKDVAVLLDSITQLARAYNTALPPSGKLLSGGVDPAALHRAKRFFGAARNLEEGGSLTVIGTALVDTGSRMDELVFEELSGKGNAEIYLDRQLMRQRVFPCMDVNKSGTRKEELLVPEPVSGRLQALRQALQPLDAVAAIEFLTDKLRTTEDNAEFIGTMGPS